MAKSDTLGVDVAQFVFGNVGGRVMPIFISVSAFGSCVGNLFVGARIVYASGRDGELPAWLGVVNQWTLTPLRGVLVETGLAIVLLTTMSSLDTLISFFSIATWLFYIAVVAGMLRLRWTEPNLPRPSRAPAVIVVFFLVSASALLVLQCVFDPRSTLLGFAVGMAGVAYYYCFAFERKVTIAPSSVVHNGYGSI